MKKEEKKFNQEQSKELAKAFKNLQLSAKESECIKGGTAGGSSCWCKTHCVVAFCTSTTWSC